MRHDVGARRPVAVRLATATAPAATASRATAATAGGHATAATSGRAEHGTTEPARHRAGTRPAVVVSSTPASHCGTPATAVRARTRTHVTCGVILATATCGGDTRTVGDTATSSGAVSPIVDARRHPDGTAGG